MEGYARDRHRPRSGGSHRDAIIESATKSCRDSVCHGASDHTDLTASCMLGWPWAVPVGAFATASTPVPFRRRRQHQLSHRLAHRRWPRRAATDPERLDLVGFAFPALPWPMTRSGGGGASRAQLPCNYRRSRQGINLTTRGMPRLNHAGFTETEQSQDGRRRHNRLRYSGWADLHRLACSPCGAPGPGGSSISPRPACFPHRSQRRSGPRLPPQPA